MADAITIKALQDASLDAKTLEEAVNGDAVTTVLSRLGETYPTLSNALNQIDGQISDANDMLVESVTTLFTNGGLPATPFATKALMTASVLVDGKYAMVTDGGADNGLYVKTAGSWVKSAYDPLSQAKSYTDSKVATDNSDDLAHAFIDVDSKLLASIDVNGKFDFDPSEASKKRIGVLTDNGDTDYAFLFVDAENKVLGGWDKDGNDLSSKDSPTDNGDADNGDTDYAVLVLDAENKVLGGWDKYGNDMSSKGGSEPTDSFSPAPLTHEKSAVEITDFSRVIEKLNVNTVAKGRTTDPDIVLEGNGFTHPKLVYVPEGWNGYKYWLAATPTFGITPNDAYENPHVFCSNDMLTWLEPTGAPIDLPDHTSSTGFWSDTHLVIDDDGWMYCFYRGNYFYGYASSFIVAKKTRDGVNWSERMIVYDPAVGGVDNGILSPAIYKNGNKWQYVDILKKAVDGLEFETNYGRGIFRRSSNDIMGDYGTYTLDHLVNITNRPWGVDKAPWHIDAIKVGNLYLILLAVGRAVDSYANELYLAWSSDGWNYTAFDRLNTLFFNCYRSSISLREVVGSKIHLDVVVSRTTGFNGGNLDLFNLTLETK